MSDPRIHRSLLYVPAIRLSAIAKARALPCDVVILDLEDAVAPDMKNAAREAAVAAVAAGGWDNRTLLIRVNGVATPWAEHDFAAVRTAGTAGIVVPKVDGATGAATAVAMAAGAPVWAMIETPRAIAEAAAIAATPGVEALVAGFADLAKDLGIRPDAARTPLHYSIGAIIVAARAAGIPAFDGIYADISDSGGCRAEAEQARMFGFDGKTVIHPSQIEIVNSAFTPSIEEVADAHGLIAAHDAAAADGRGVTTYAGKLVELLHVAQARRLIANAAAIEAR